MIIVLVKTVIKKESENSYSIKVSLVYISFFWQALVVWKLEENNTLWLLKD